MHSALEIGEFVREIYYAFNITDLSILLFQFSLKIVVEDGMKQPVWKQNVSFSFENPLFQYLYSFYSLDSLENEKMRLERTMAQKQSEYESATER